MGTHEKGPRKERKAKKKAKEALQASRESYPSTYKDPTGYSYNYYQDRSCEVKEKPVTINYIFTHTVQEHEGISQVIVQYIPYLTGESLDKKVEEVYQYNNLTTYILQPGQKLKIDTKSEKEKIAQWNKLEQVRSSYKKNEGKSLPGGKTEKENTNKKYEGNKDFKALYLEEEMEGDLKKRFFNEYHRYWHITTHGEGGSIDTAISPLILTKEGFDTYKAECRIEDGNLTANEIRQLPLKDVELIFINACQTALDNYDLKTEKRQESVGEAALDAGAKNSITNFWKVNDTTALELATEFYECLFERDMSIEDSLRAAQEKNKKNYPDPYYWASPRLLSKDKSDSEYSTGDIYNDEISSVTEEIKDDYINVNDNTQLHRLEDRVANRIETLKIRKKDLERKKATKNDKIIDIRKENQDLEKLHADPAYQKLDAENDALTYEILQIEEKIKNISYLVEKHKGKTEGKNSKLIEKSIQNKLEKSSDSRIIDISKKLTRYEAVVDIKKIVDSNRKTIYVALITDSDSTDAPKVIVLNNIKNRIETSNYEYFKNTINGNIEDTLSYEVFWKDIDMYLKSIDVTKIYLHTEGVFEQMSLNAIYNSQTKKYVFDEYKIQYLSQN